MDTPQTVEGAQERIAASRRRADAAYYVNHPTTAFRAMRKLAEDVLALCDENEAARGREGEMRDALETIERTSAKPEPALPSRIVNINNIARRGLAHRKPPSAGTRYGTTDEGREG